MRDCRNPSATVKRSCWGEKERYSNHLTRHATLLSKSQHGSRNTEAPFIPTARHITDVKILDLEAVMLTTLIQIPRRLNCCTRIHHLLDLVCRPAVRPSWKRQLQRAPQSFLTRSSTTPIYDGRFCDSCLLRNHPDTQCTAIPPHLCATVINTCEANLPSIAKRCRWYPEIFTADIRHKNTVFHSQSRDLSPSNMHQ